MHSSRGLFSTFLEKVKIEPNKPAVIYKQSSLTYAELEINIREIASHLRSRYSQLFAVNAKPMIGVKCRSKLNALQYELAILALGGSFVPFNISDPEARQKFMIEKSGISLILTDFDHPIHPSVNYLNIPRYLSENTIISLMNEYPEESANDLAYVLFTSGSTANNPKGVMRSRDALLKQMVRDYKNDINLITNDIVQNVAPLSHDQGIVDCCAALLNGCTLCLYEESEISQNIDAFHQFMITNKVSVFSSIPSIFAHIFSSITNQNMFPHLRVVTIGGEEVLVSHALLFQNTCPKTCVLIIGYGATEISWISSYIITHQTNLSTFKMLPLGYLTASAKMKLLPIDTEDTQNEKLNELCIRSDGLASGYLNDEKANQKAFVKDEDGIYYRTGDLVKIDENNCIHFLGRINWLVKINGKRVDLREVEFTLRSLPHFNDCIVIAHGEGTYKKLYAFYTKKISIELLNESILELKKLLPAYMLPIFFHINTIPLLTNGKVNSIKLHDFLPSPLAESEMNAILDLQEYDNLADVIEGIWREIFSIPMNIEVDEKSSFNQLGGSSMNAMQFIYKVNQYFVKNKASLRIDFFNLDCNYSQLSECIINRFLTRPFHIENDEIKSNLTNELTVTITHKRAQTKNLVNILWKVNGHYTPVKTILFRFNALTLLVEYFNDLHKLDKIFMAIAKDIADIKQIIEDFKSGPLSQMGLIFFRNNNPEDHPISAVLCKDEINDKLILLVIDARPGFGLLFHSLAVEEFSAYMLENEFVLFELEKQIPNLEIRFDLTGKQLDVHSCTLAIILNLIAALQCNMLKECIFLSTTFLEAFNTNAFSNKTEGLILTPKLKTSTTFISPPQTFYYSHITSFPNFLDIPFSKEIQQIIQEVKKYEVQHELMETCQIIDESITPPIVSEVRINTSLWKKSYEFKKLIETKLTNSQQNSSSTHTNNPAILFQPAPVLNTDNIVFFLEHKLELNREKHSL